MKNYYKECWLKLRTTLTDKVCTSCYSKDYVVICVCLVMFDLMNRIEKEVHND